MGSSALVKSESKGIIWTIDNKGSEGKFSVSKSLLNVLVELLKSNSLGVVTSNSVNYFPKLLLSEPVSELLVNIFKFVERQFSCPLKVVQTKVSTSSLFSKWASLNSNKLLPLWQSKLSKTIRSLLHLHWSRWSQLTLWTQCRIFHQDPEIWQS